MEPSSNAEPTSPTSVDRATPSEQGRAFKASPGRAWEPVTTDRAERHQTWTVRRISAESRVLLGVDLLLIAVALPFIVASGGTAGIVATGLLAPTLAALRLYRQRYTVSLLDDLPRLVLAPILATALAGAVVILFEPGGNGTLLIQPVHGVWLMAAIILSRLVTYPFLRWMRRRGHWVRPTLIFGGGDVAMAIGRYIKAAPETGLRLVGYVERGNMPPDRTLPAPWLGEPDDLQRLIREKHVDNAIFAFSAMPSKDLVNYIRLCDREDTTMTVVPRFFEMATMQAGSSGDSINGMPLVTLNRAPFRSLMWPLKRVLDLLVASLAIVLTSPIMLGIAAWSRITEGPGVIFRQRRVGSRGAEFDVLKFRSMKPATSSEGDTRWNIRDDDRLTTFGRFIRKTSLDELPQLFNVLVGQMSLVGPRPERPHFVEVFSDADDRYWARHRVPVGLTGWAQIHGLRGDTSIEERASFDNYYIENWSLWLDIKIIIITSWSLFKGSG